MRDAAEELTDQAMQRLAEKLARRSGVSVSAARTLLLEATKLRCDGSCKRSHPHGPVWAEAVPSGRRLPRVVVHTCWRPS
jgi:hypothetical protein